MGGGRKSRLVCSMPNPIRDSLLGGVLKPGWFTSLSISQFGLQWEESLKKTVLSVSALERLNPRLFTHRTAEMITASAGKKHFKKRRRAMRGWGVKAG